MENTTKRLYSPTRLLSLPALIIMILALAGCKDSDPAPKPEADFSYISDNNFEAPTVVSFINESKNATSYAWDFGDGATSESESPSHEFEEPGTYTVTLTATRGTLTDTHSEEVAISAPDPDPTAAFSFTSDNDFHTPTVITFTNESAHATSFEWNFGDDSEPSTDENPVHTYTESGTYTITLTATGNSISATETAEITVTPFTPVAGFTFSPNSNLIVPAEVNFTNTAEHAASWEWDFGDGSDVSTEKDPVHIYTVPGAYEVTLTVTNETLTASKTEMITIEPPVYTGVYIVTSVELAEELVIGPNTYEPGTDVTEDVLQVFRPAGCGIINNLYALKSDGTLYFTCGSSSVEEEVGAWDSDGEAQSLVMVFTGEKFPQEIEISIEQVSVEGNILTGFVYDYSMWWIPGSPTASVKVTMEKQ